MIKMVKRLFRHTGLALLLLYSLYLKHFSGKHIWSDYSVLVPKLKVTDTLGVINARAYFQ